MTCTTVAGLTIAGNLGDYRNFRWVLKIAVRNAFASVVVNIRTLKLPKGAVCIVLQIARFLQMHPGTDKAEVQKLAIYLGEEPSAL